MTKCHQDFFNLRRYSFVHYWHMHKSMQDTILQPMYVTRHRADRGNAKSITASIPLGRIGETMDIAKVALL